MKSSSTFFGNSDEFRLTSLQRLSFFLYSCERDKFQTKLKTIISNIKDLLVEQRNFAHRESSIYLILRVLFIRFSHENLLEILRQLWPMIFTDIIIKLSNTSDSQIKNDGDVVLAVLKFIEFLSVVNKEFFSAFQWVFFQDTNDLNRLRISEEKITFTNTCFKPLSMEVLKGFEYLSEFESYKAKINLDSIKKDPLIMSKIKVIFYFRLTILKIFKQTLLK